MTDTPNCESDAMATRTALAAAIILIQLAWHAGATTYYVAPNGRNSNGGSTPDAPLQSIQAAVDKMSPGDKCIVGAGVYRESVRIPASDITIEGAAGAEVYVVGTQPIDGWETHDGPIMKAHMPWSMGDLYDGKPGYDQVFVDGIMMVQARTPNIDAVAGETNADGRRPTGGDYPFKAGRPPSDGSLLMPATVALEYPAVGEMTLSDAPGLRRGTDFWKGGIVTFLKNYSSWWWQAAEITGSDGDRIRIDDSQWSYSTPTSGFGVLMGVLGALDAPGEWHRQNDTLYLRPPEGTSLPGALVEAKRRVTAFSAQGQKDITLRNLRIMAASASFSACTSCVIDDCHFRYVSNFNLFDKTEQANSDDYANIDRSDGRKGVFFSGSTNTIIRSSVAYSSGSGVVVGGMNPHYDTKNDRLVFDPSFGTTIENCLIHDVDYSGTYEGGIFVDFAGGCRIRRNTIHRCGRSTINLRHTGGYARGEYAQDIQYNNLHDAMLLSNDGGVVYAYGVASRGTEFAHNWVWNSYSCNEGALLYLDYHGWDWLIHHNVFWLRDGSNPHHLAPDTLRNIAYNNTCVDLTKRAMAEKWRYPGDNDIAASHDNPIDWQFVDTAGFDFRLEQGSPAIDQGRTVVGTNYGDYRDRTYNGILESPITLTDFTGDSPDLGAYEYGLERWIAGHDWGEPLWSYPAVESEIAPVAHSPAAFRARLAIRENVLLLHPQEGGPLSLRLFDVTGRLVLVHHSNQGGVQRVSLESVGAGTYTAQVTAKGRHSSHTVSVLH